ncbi:unnamed protein product [Symbiodinium sp. CCMP2592]|nr:unnamed protein product [Symbiodinium sp. CCMP2592]
MHAGQQTSFWEGCARFLRGDDKTLLDKFRERCKEQLEECLKRRAKSKAGPRRDTLRVVLRLHCVVYYNPRNIADSFHSLLADRRFHSLLTDPSVPGHSELFRRIGGDPLWQYFADLFGNDVEKNVASEVLGKGGAEWRPHLQDLVDERVARYPRVALPLLDALGRAWEHQLCSDTDMDSEDKVMKATPRVQSDPRTTEELQRRARAQHKAPRPGLGSRLSDSRDIDLGVSED